jgi:PAS domain S-box-containing protein
LVTLNGRVEDARFKPVNPRKDINSAVSMPIIAGGNLLGVLNVNTTQSRRAFTLGQIKGLSILISIVAPVLESSWLYDKIRQAEEKYRSIFENSIEGIFQTTPEGRFFTANPAIARMCGYDTPEELIATVKSIKEELYVRPEERDRFKRILHEKNVVSNFEAELRRKDGTTFWVSINARKISNKDGENEKRPKKGSLRKGRNFYPSLTTHPSEWLWPVKTEIFNTSTLNLKRCSVICSTILLTSKPGFKRHALILHTGTP